jgi:hypothetical protein
VSLTYINTVPGIELLASRYLFVLEPITEPNSDGNNPGSVVNTGNPMRSSCCQIVRSTFEIKLAREQIILCKGARELSYKRLDSSVLKKSVSR